MRDVGDVTVGAQEDVQQDLRAMFRGAIRASLELFLEAELDALVGGVVRAARRASPCSTWTARMMARTPCAPWKRCMGSSSRR